MVCPLTGDHPQRGVSLSDADPLGLHPHRRGADQGEYQGAVPLLRHGILGHGALPVQHERQQRAARHAVAGHHAGGGQTPPSGHELPAARALPRPGGLRKHTAAHGHHARPVGQRVGAMRHRPARGRKRRTVGIPAERNGDARLGTRHGPAARYAGHAAGTDHRPTDALPQAGDRISGHPGHQGESLRRC